MSQVTGRILRLPEIQEKTGLSRSSIYAYMQKNLFPRQVHLGPRCVGWLEKDVEEWIASCVAKHPKA